MIKYYGVFLLIYLMTPLPFINLVSPFLHQKAMRILREYCEKEDKPIRPWLEKLSNVMYWVLVGIVAIINIVWAVLLVLFIISPE